MFSSVNFFLLCVSFGVILIAIYPAFQIRQSSSNKQFEPTALNLVRCFFKYLHSILLQSLWDDFAFNNKLDVI